MASYKSVLGFSHFKETALTDRDCVDLQELERAYCPPLDPALFNAIVSDFDLANPESRKELEDTLDALKVTAEEQQDQPFDPSGTGGLGLTNGLEADGSASRNDTNGSPETDVTSLQSDFSSVFLDNDRQHAPSHRSSSQNNATYIVGLNGSLNLTGMTVEEKTDYLSEMFPSVTPFNLQHTLAKCEYDVDRSMDVLLNLAFFEENSSIDDEDKIFMPKGIDGFSEASSVSNGRRKRKNNKSRAKAVPGSPSLGSPAMSPSRDASTVNKWNAAKDDMEFICSRTTPVLKKEAVASAYHKNGASLPATIRFLATSHAPKVVSDDPVTAEQVSELAHEFASIHPTTLEGLLRIARNSVSAAHELAAAMLTKPTPQLQDIIQFTAPSVVEDENVAPSTSAESSRIGSDFSRGQSTAPAHFTASSEAFTKASAAYRRGRSDRLMGGAAAYYSALGRDHLERAKRESSAAADALVHSQSSADVLDLHGVSVQDAVRIARVRVSQWWDSLGEIRYVPGGGAARSPYRIITGAGRHSRDGTSRLGPAVGKMLAREGWRVEVAEGVLTITGMVRRR